jgi:4-hydroxyphenylpyruvate dioxygenase
MTTLEVVAPADLLLGWDAIELWVGNARAVAQELITGFGFTCTGYAGPETGVRDRCSYLVEQGAIRFVVTASLVPGSVVWEHVQRHGDGVKALGFEVHDVRQAFTAALERGATSAMEPHWSADRDGEVETAAVAAYGETIHRFTRRRHRVFAPGYTADDLVHYDLGRPVGLLAVDHVVGNVPDGSLGQWVDFYRSVFGFTEMTHFDRDQISTEYSGLRSTVVTNGAGITMPINEPAAGRRRSQIQEYLDSYNGPGVQHIAFRTDDILTAVAELRRRGIRFLTPPPSYYEAARSRVTGIDDGWDEIARLGILVDQEPDGHLLQVFTEPVGDRPTLFFEIIERRGATGFGEGNFKALFEAIEREQARRGNL